MKFTCFSRVRSLCAAAVAAAGLASAPALAAEESAHPEDHPFSFDGAFGEFDQAQLQRGYQVYREVCASCHSMELLDFRHLAMKGGPFYDESVPSPIDNPQIKALAAQFQYDTVDDYGDTVQRPGVATDPLPSPWPNKAAGAAANGGKYPPDLSVIAYARHGKADYIRSLLIGYEDPPEYVEQPIGVYYNKYYPGHWIKMPQLLYDGSVAYDDGTEATAEQMATDVAAFLMWASDPHAEQRKRTGVMVLGYLGVFALILWIQYKQIWRNVKH